LRSADSQGSPLTQVDGAKINMMSLPTITTKQWAVTNKKKWGVRPINGAELALTPALRWPSSNRGRPSKRWSAPLPTAARPPGPQPQSQTLSAIVETVEKALQVPI